MSYGEQGRRERRGKGGGRRRGKREDGSTCRRNAGERYDGVALLRFAYGSEIILHHCHLCRTEAGKACTFRTLPSSLARSRARRNRHRARAPADLPTSLAVSTLCPGAVDSRFSAPSIVDRPRGGAEHVFLEGRTVWADGSRRPIGSHRAAFSFCLDSTHKANLHLPWVASTTIAACPVGQDDSYV